MDYIDLFVAPIYLVIIYLMAFIIIINNRKDPLIQKYFLYALHVRIIGSIVLGLIYYFYYKGGDTQAYYKDGLVIRDGFIADPVSIVKLLFIYDYKDPDIFPYAMKLNFYGDPHSFYVSKTVGIINLFTFGIYTVSSFFFALISLSGSWALFITFCKIAPQIEKQNAIAVLFLPSIFFWGSGILKDTITFSAMGWFVYSVHNYFILNKNRNKSILIFILSAYVMYSIKEYILISILPACAIWVVLVKLKHIKNRAQRLFLKPILFFFAIVIGLGGSSLIISETSKYSLNNVLATSAVTAAYLKIVTKDQNGSGYDLGDFEPTFSGVIKLIIPAINVALFRPYPWEIKNILMLFSSLESMFFLVTTLLLLFRVRFMKMASIINNDPFLICCLVFSLIFSFSVGLSSYNFGTLVRYKIPMLPFFSFLLFYIYYEGFLKPKKFGKE